MPLNHATGNKQFLTDLDIRIYLRDTNPEANLLIKDLEFTPEEIRTAMTLAVDKWNDQPPYLQNYDYRTFPWRSALLQGTCANLLFIAANRYRRNDLKYDAAGGSVADQDKYQQYDAAGGVLWQQFTEWIKSNKMAINMESGWGMIAGGFRSIPY